MTVKKPDTTSDNLMLIIGQLLEATKAAAEGLKSVSVEVQGNAKAIIAVSQTVKMVETTIGELKKIVSDAQHPGNLIVLTAGHTSDIRSLKTSLAELERSVDALKTAVGKLNTAQAEEQAEDKAEEKTGKRYAKYAMYVVYLIGWTVTTAIAVYAAVTAAGK